MAMEALHRMIVHLIANTSKPNYKNCQRYYKTATGIPRNTEEVDRQNQIEDILFAKVKKMRRYALVVPSGCSSTSLQAI